MGLGFHIGQGGINNLGEYLGQLDMEELSWLQRKGFIKTGETGHFPDDPIESLPYFDDVILTHDQVKFIKRKFDSKLEEMLIIPGFKSETVEKLNEILTKAFVEKQGISTLAD